MAKETKSAEETASIFDAMTKASVAGNPKPKEKPKKKSTKKK